MHLTEAIQQALRDYPSMFDTGVRVAGLESEGYQPSSDLVTLGSVIYSYMDNSDDEKKKLFSEAMCSDSYYLAELNIEGNHALLIRAVWESIAYCLADQIDQILHEQEDDEATRQGL